MDWAAVLVAVSGLVQSCVVVASLCYVIVQVSQTTKTMIASSFEQVFEAPIGIISGYMHQRVDPHFTGGGVLLPGGTERCFPRHADNVIKVGSMPGTSSGRGRLTRNAGKRSRCHFRQFSLRKAFGPSSTSIAEMQTSFSSEEQAGYPIR